MGLSKIGLLFRFGTLILLGTGDTEKRFVFLTALFVYINVMKSQSFAVSVYLPLRDIMRFLESNLALNIVYVLMPFAKMRPGESW